MASTQATGSKSPLSSPRLPSPPPFPEVQIGPKSPGLNAPSGAGISGDENTSKLDNGAMRRIRPGTKAVDMASGPPLVPLAELDSSFQLQEHLKALHHSHIFPPTATITTPLSHTTALAIATPPSNIDRTLWLYELTRFLVQKANDLIVSFFRETPPCSALTCPEMRASEWQYLCAVHEPPKSCCAIDYCCHTLDWASFTLTSQKYFPSRLTLGSEAQGGSQVAVKHLTNVMRRVYRIFAHAWFQHRQVFWQVEGNEGLYILFKTVCDVYSLIPEENYTIPPEAEGLSSAAEEEQEEKLRVVKLDEREDGEGDDADTTNTIPTSATTRRHKHTPSVGSSFTTIAEGDEDDNPSGSPANQNAVKPTAILLSSTPKEAPLAQNSTAEMKQLPPPAVKPEIPPPTQPTPEVVKPDIKDTVRAVPEEAEKQEEAETKDVERDEAIAEEKPPLEAAGIGKPTITKGVETEKAETEE